jgi:hypothetical protein
VRSVSELRYHDDNLPDHVEDMAKYTARSDLPGRTPFAAAPRLGDANLRLLFLWSWPRIGMPSVQR